MRKLLAALGGAIALALASPVSANVVYEESGVIDNPCNPWAGCYDDYFEFGYTFNHFDPSFQTYKIFLEGRYKFDFELLADNGISATPTVQVWAWGLYFDPYVNWLEQRLYYGPGEFSYFSPDQAVGYFDVGPHFDVTNGNVRAVGDEYGVVTIGVWVKGGTQTPYTFTVTTVPEPATWALMILGCGASGAALRRRRQVVGA